MSFLKNIQPESQFCPEPRDKPYSTPDALRLHRFRVISLYLASQLPSSDYPIAMGEQRPHEKVGSYLRQKLTILLLVLLRVIFQDIHQEVIFALDHEINRVRSRRPSSPSVWRIYCKQSQTTQVSSCKRSHVFFHCGRFRLSLLHHVFLNQIAVLELSSLGRWSFSVGDLVMLSHELPPYPI